MVRSWSLASKCGQVEIAWSRVENVGVCCVKRHVGIRGLTMKKVTVSVCLLCACWLAGRGVAEDAFVYPTLPGTNLRDYSKPGARIEDDKIYPTLPGSSLRDYSKPGARIEDEKIYPTLPGSSLRDYSKPGVKIEENNIHPTLPGAGIRDYSKPGARIESDRPLSDSGAGLWHYQNSRPKESETSGIRPVSPSDATNNARSTPRAQNDRIFEDAPGMPDPNDDPFPSSDEK